MFTRRRFLVIFPAFAASAHAQTAGRHLQHAIQSGYDNGREMYTMTVDEVLEHANAVVKEAGRTDNLPSLPVINPDIRPEDEMGIHLPGEPA